MDPDLYMIREEGGERPEAGAVRDELDNQASSSKKLRKIFQKKVFEIFPKTFRDLQRSSKTYRDKLAIQVSSESCCWILIALDHRVNCPNSR